MVGGHTEKLTILPSGMNIIVYGVVYGIQLTEQEQQNAQEL
jgi:hypothetical protein